MESILVTGGSGFIGSNFIKLALNEVQNLKIINLDILSYASNSKNLKEFEGNDSYEFVKGDIADPEITKKIFERFRPTKVINFAAESHVDRSIHDPENFIRTNILGTSNLLDTAKKAWNENYEKKLFLQISTDEVYGSMKAEQSANEETSIRPNSPYSASKASADHICRAYNKTYSFPVIISRCSNNYGPHQHNEKLIPSMITRAIKNQTLPLYGDGLNVRDWIYVSDHCKALLEILKYGSPGEIYNIGAGEEYKNIEIVKMILKQLQKGESLIDYVKDRPGHDKRYSLDCSKIKETLSWDTEISLADGLKKTIEWYKKQEEK